ncbi:MAG: hypothetical protein IK088_00915 [Lachnospiraceae bacterium]|nr:hypothetical protein [Lachnospiraceae bacterium]
METAKEFSVGMAIVDLVPVACFAVASVILMRDLYNKFSKGAFALFAAGLIDIIAAGALKAVYKLLYAAGICDFTPLNTMFFPVQSIGFLLAGLGIVAMICHRQKSTALAAAPPVFTGTFIFVAFMVAGLGMMDTVLSILSVKLNKPWLTVLFVISFCCSLCMGYLSTKNFDNAAMNWIAEGVNLLGQALFLLGSVLLHKNGLEALRLRNEVIQ